MWTGNAGHSSFRIHVARLGSWQTHFAGRKAFFAATSQRETL